MTITTSKYSNGKFKKHRDAVLMDKTYELTLNKTFQGKCSASPRQLKELIVGYACLNDGLMHHTDIYSYSIDQHQISLEYKQSGEKMYEQKCSQIFHQELIALMEDFQEFSQLYRQTGIAVTVALANTQQLVTRAEDISLEAGLYKVVGEWLLNNQEALDIIMISEPILPYIVEIAVKLGVNTIVSRSGISHQAYIQAQKKGVTTVCFCRGANFTVYTGLETVV